MALNAMSVENCVDITAKASGIKGQPQGRKFGKKENNQVTVE
jgi:hypothetical protein